MLKRLWYVLCALWFLLVIAIPIATGNYAPTAQILFPTIAVAPFILGHVFYRLFCFVLTGDFFPAELKPRS